MKLIDADKLLKWLEKQTEMAYDNDINAQDAFMVTTWAITDGRFDVKGGITRKALNTSSNSEGE